MWTCVYRKHLVIAHLNQRVMWTFFYRQHLVSSPQLKDHVNFCLQAREKVRTYVKQDKIQNFSWFILAQWFQRKRFFKQFTTTDKWWKTKCNMYWILLGKKPKTNVNKIIANWEYCQTSLMWPSKGTLKYCHQTCGH
jgi:hypothetical protein